MKNEDMPRFYEQSSAIRGAEQSSLAHPRLEDSVVCADIECDTVFHRSFESCPRCGKTGFYPIGKWIGRQDGNSKLSLIDIKYEAETSIDELFADHKKIQRILNEIWVAAHPVAFVAINSITPGKLIFPGETHHETCVSKEIAHQEQSEIEYQCQTQEEYDAHVAQMKALWDGVQPVRISSNEG